VINVKSIAVVAEDRVGLLADISYILGKSGLNLDGLMVDVVGGKAVISLETKDVAKAKKILETNGFATTDTGSIVIKVNDHIRAVEQISEILEAEKVRIRNMTMLSSDSNGGIYSIKVDKPRKANRILDSFLLGNDACPC
jgi:hypothetical protein